MEQKVKIFLFHRISPVRDKMWDPIDPALFRKLIKYITKKYSVYTVEELFYNNYNNYNIHNTNKPLACITFDDGYKDFIHYALPVLQEYSAKSSIYVVTNCISSGLPPWTYVLDYLFLNSKKNNLSKLSDILECPEEQLKFENVSSRIKYGKLLKKQLKKVSDIKRRNIFNSLVSFFDEVEIPSDLMMNSEDIVQISDAGVITGSHTVSHPLLSKIEDETMLYNELKVSGLEIERITGKFPITISYPVGSYDDRVMKLSEKAGYKIGLAVEQKEYKGNLTASFNIPRIEIYNENYFKSLLRLNGYIERIKKLL
jgi:peptidoglycan/xylan/chitin deacetylase (PgdA/CDA1 family)